MHKSEAANQHSDTRTLQGLRSRFAALPASNIFFFAIYGIWLVHAILERSIVIGFIPHEVDIAINFAVLLLIPIMQLLEKRGFQGVLPLLIGLVLGCIIKVVSDTSFMIILVAFIFCARLVPFKRIALFTAVVSSITLFAIVVLSQVGVIQDYIWYADDRNRHGLGFLYCTTPSHYILAICILWIIVREDKLRIIEIACMLLIAALIYSLTFSRNSFFLVLLMLVMFLILRFAARRKRMSGWILHLLAWIPFIVLPIGSFVLCFFYDSGVGWQYGLNELLSNRLAQTHASLHAYPVTPFGQAIQFVGYGITPDGVREMATVRAGDPNYVDNSYLQVLLCYGFVTLLALVSCLIAAGFKIAKTDNWVIPLALFIFALHSTFDPQMVNLDQSTLLLLIAILLPGQRMLDAVMSKYQKKRHE